MGNERNQLISAQLSFCTYENKKSFVLMFSSYWQKSLWKMIQSILY